MNRSEDPSRRSKEPPLRQATLDASVEEARLTVPLYNDATVARAFARGLHHHMRRAWLYLRHARFVSDDADFRYWDPQCTNRLQPYARDAETSLGNGVAALKQSQPRLRKTSSHHSAFPSGASLSLRPSAERAFLAQIVPDQAFSQLPLSWRSMFRSWKEESGKNCL